ncbi:MAG: hypothetical protein P4L27_08030 [Ignavibacteriaceae bacterium]|nr:hypothetical protein [Ignavibacteriaceae bacterium]
MGLSNQFPPSADLGWLNGIKDKRILYPLKRKNTVQSIIRDVEFKDIMISNGLDVVKQRHDK